MRVLSTVQRAIRQHGLWVTALLTVAVFFGMFVVGDASQVVSALLAVDLWRIGVVFLLATISYGVRFLKWEYYLRHLDIDIPLKTSLIVFFSGLMMVVTPGKAGEVWKAWFLRDLRDVPVSRTASVVGAERVTDLIALSVFAFLGILIYQRSSVVLIGVILLFLFGISLLQWRNFCLRVLRWLETLPIVGSYATELEKFYENTYTLFQVRPLSIAFLISLVAWGLEGVALWVVLSGFSSEATLLAALFVFGLGSVVGAASLLPGGLAAAEASMVGMLVILGYTQTIAVSATVIIRVGTLWYGAILGTCVFVVYRFVRDQAQVTNPSN
ncbi:flippase-like domain-containing protein [Halobaculum sp. CBA1158]|uniref:lysylphosphatidylglycerol synthase transmembrane domain-containing protein n=1 Tax=Halobaculum sp. CBA1158 TaxID=2904243 RepID=UPI001F31F790|nr:lysylphosphatidylglycerol synthase transmembrane domain-containing protein [Halobaculum sp. CBA1158]UIP00989.1 flippase-like domain-containing protein [Halobaculum sp. CBA1158]